MEENKTLKLEIAKLKGAQLESVNIAPKVPSYASVDATQYNHNKVLVVKPKSQQDVKTVKQDLKDKVNPEELGVGVSIGRATKNGGLILSCGKKKEIIDIQSEI